MMNWFPKISTVILANGEFPKHKIPLSILQNSIDIICCDGAVEKLIKRNIQPKAIVGDMDSLSLNLKKKFKSIIHLNKSQDTNDLTKSINWCLKTNKKEIAILGATGRREDHTIGNIFLLQFYSKNLKRVIMFTDNGIFTPIIKSTTFTSFPNQIVSVFSTDKTNRISSTGLKYPLEKNKLNRLWQGTLNQSLASSFSIKIENSNNGIIVYQGYE